jgi:hypothetical protein
MYALKPLRENKNQWSLTSAIGFVYKHFTFAFSFIILLCYEHYEILYPCGWN